MRNWYDMIMSETNRVANPMFANAQDFFNNDPVMLEQGVVINRWHLDSAICSTSLKYDGAVDDIMFTGLRMLPVFSARLQRALTDAHVGVHDVQYLPLRIFQSTGELTEGFSIPNVITRVPALDRERCFLLETDPETIDPLTGDEKIQVIGRIALKAAPLAGHHIVRLVEYPRAFLVSDDVVRVFRRHAFTGPLFSKLEVSDD